MSKLKQLFPNHKLRDKHDYELQQFTANDMIDFAETVAKEALRNARDSFDIGDIEITEGGIVCSERIEKLISDENNIPKI